MRLFMGSSEKQRKRMGFAELIIKKRHFIESIFIVIIIVSVLCIPFVSANYDLSKYLPSYAPSKHGLDIMEEEFGYPGTARIMVGDVSIYEAKIYKDKISNIDGVDMVLWLDTMKDVYMSDKFIDYDDASDYYKDNYAVMTVMFDEGDASKKTHKAIDEIDKLLGDKGYLTGTAVQNKSLSETLANEMKIAISLGVVMIAIILCLTTTAWVEPILFLVIMAVAILINMGTNIFLGEISFLTKSVAALLQLAIAMDYSVFLLHTFTHEKERGIETEQALANAIRISSISILSSGMTTIVGFIVLALMQFAIGFDMGIVLAKGIVISLLTVMLLMPALILRFNNAMQKTAHKSFMPSFKKLGVGIYKIRKVFFVAVLILIVPAYIAQGMNNFVYGNDALGSSEGTRVYEDEQQINKIFGRANTIVALVPNSNIVTEREFSEEIEDLEYVNSVISMGKLLPEGVPEKIIPESLRELLHKEKYSRILISAATAGESELAFRASDEICSIMQRYYPEDSHLVGLTPSTQDIKRIITADYNRVNILSLIGVALVLLFTFKSGIIPIIVLIPIETAIFFNMALPYIAGTEITFMGYIIVSCLQLGATVDYSILVTNKYLDARTLYAKRRSAIEAIKNSALSIFTSGSILTIAGYGLYFVSSVAAVGDLGRLVGRGAFLSMILVLIMLPALLVMTDKAIFSQKRRLHNLDRIHKIRLRKFDKRRKLRLRRIETRLHARMERVSKFKEWTLYSFKRDTKENFKRIKLKLEKIFDKKSESADKSSKEAENNYEIHTENADDKENEKIKSNK